MKRLVFGLLVALVAGGNCGCCCFWHEMHQFKSALHHSCPGFPFSCGGPGCNTHYLQTYGAEYGSYCGSCNAHAGCGHGCGDACGVGGCGGCAKSGCGELYLGGLFTPRHKDPCDNCGNFVTGYGGMPHAPTCSPQMQHGGAVVEHTVEPPAAQGMQQAQRPSATRRPGGRAVSTQSNNARMEPTPVR